MTTLVFDEYSYRIVNGQHYLYGKGVFIGSYWTYEEMAQRVPEGNEIVFKGEMTYEEDKNPQEHPINPSDFDVIPELKWETVGVILR